jgi:hypothetical protein
MYTLPKGKYYLGDPCYVLQTKNHDDWLNVLNKSDYFRQPYVKGKKQAIAFETAYGDGEYQDQLGNSYPVDAGMIGLVPVSMATVKKPKGVHMFTFDGPVVCEQKGALLKFGKYEIDTGPQESEEDEEYCFQSRKVNKNGSE